MKKTPEKEIMFEFKRLYKEAIRNELSDESASFADVIQDKAEPYISRSSTGGAVAAKKVRKKNQYGNEGIKKRHKQLIKNGKNHNEALQILSENFGLSKRQISRII